MTTVPSILKAAARLRQAQQLSYLVSTTSETNLRGRWGRQCDDAGQMTAHLILSVATDRASIRLNSEVIRGRVLSDAGWQLVWCLATEHGAAAWWRDSPAIVDIHLINVRVAPLIIGRLINPLLWTIPSEVR